MSNLELEQFTYMQEAGIANKYNKEGVQLIQISCVIRETVQKGLEPCVAGWISYELLVSLTVSCIRPVWW